MLGIHHLPHATFPLGTRSQQQLKRIYKLWTCTKRAEYFPPQRLGAFSPGVMTSLGLHKASSLVSEEKLFLLVILGVSTQQYGPRILQATKKIIVQPQERLSTDHMPAWCHDTSPEVDYMPKSASKCGRSGGSSDCRRPSELLQSPVSAEADPPQLARGRSYLSQISRAFVVLSIFSVHE